MNRSQRCEKVLKIGPKKALLVIFLREIGDTLGLRLDTVSSFIMTNTCSRYHHFVQNNATKPTDTQCFKKFINDTLKNRDLKMVVHFYTYKLL